MSGSRTHNAIKNTFWVGVCKIVYLLITFACRTVLTKTLGAEYLGINGLFSNVLTILSFVELGIGTALVYRLYAPIADNDKQKVRQYLALYRKIYNIIIIIVALLGILFIPVIPYIVDAPDIKENITLLYILYLMQTLVTYVFVYKKSIFLADQKSYVVNICTQIFNIIMNLFQFIFLVVTHNFIIYCVLNITFNILNNICCSVLANKKYPYITEQSKDKLSKDEISSLIKDVKGLLLTKIASTAFSGTDNIFISAFINIRYVGILSNYTMISGIINGIMNDVFSSITSSIGNLKVTGNDQQVESVLKKMFFINTTLYSYMCLGLLFLLKSFVTDIWLSESYALSTSIVVFIVIELFFRSIHYPLYTTRNALGCFSEYKILFALFAVLNIILDYILVKPLGISGLYLATIICRGGTYIADIWVVYHMQFKKSIMNYIYIIIKWLILLLICCIVLQLIFSNLKLSGILGFTLKCLIITMVYFISYILAFGKSEEFVYLKSLLIKLFHRAKEA